MSEHLLRELLDVVSSGLQRFGDGITTVGAKIGDIFHSLGEQLRRNMCATSRRSYGCSAGPIARSRAEELHLPGLRVG